MLASRSHETCFHVSPASVLRNNPARAASQMSPRLSTATALMANSGSIGLDGNQLSPPFTETATVLRPAIATTLPATLMLMGTLEPASVSCRQLSPESVLTYRPVELAANQRSPANSKTLTRALSSFGTGGRGAFFFAAAGSAAPGRSVLRGVQR